MKKVVKYTEVLEANDIIIKKTCELSIEEVTKTSSATKSKVSLKMLTIVLLEIVAVAVVYLCAEDFDYKNIVELIKTIISNIK